MLGSFQLRVSVLFFAMALLMPICPRAGAVSLTDGELIELLQNQGLVGRMHGVFPKLHQYVFTRRDPQDFFESEQFSLIARDPKVIKVLDGLSRHDEVRIFGKLLSPQTSQRHVLVTRLEIIESYQDKDKPPPYSHQEGLLEELQNQSTLVGKIHAIAHEATVLVIEYKDWVFPLVTPKGFDLQGYYRNDIVRIKFLIASSPHHPPHLALDDSQSTPLEVVHPIVGVHDQALDLEGSLVLFAQSPQLKFPVFAIQVTTPEGPKVNYTLVNFSDMDLFFALQNKAKAAWEAHESSAINDRNKWVNPKIRVRVQGKGHVVSPQQANPQVLIEDLEDLQLTWIGR